MFVIARNYGGDVAPAVNVLTFGWVAWEEFCRCVKEKRPVCVTFSDSDNHARVNYDAGSLDEITVKDEKGLTSYSQPVTV